MNVRFATLEDLQAINEMYSEYKGEGLENIGMEFDREITQRTVAGLIENGKVIILESAGKVIGSIAGIFSPSYSSKDIYFVGVLFYVQKAFRSKTQGFLREARKLLKDTNATHIVLASPAHEPRTALLYAADGFKEIERHFIKPL